MQCVTAERGLSAHEARKRLERWGPNALPQSKRTPIWRVFLKQFQSPLIYILIVAAALAAVLGKREDACVILLVVTINAIIGALQEGRAERSMELLVRLAALKAAVLRDGCEQIVEARELVPGDVLLLSAGDAVGADARLLKVAALETAEAALTGESLPTIKAVDPLPADTLLADRCNMVFSGTYVVAGRGRAVVVGTGLSTEVGKIAQLTVTAEPPKTPLELRLAQFGRGLVIAAFVLFAVVMGFGTLRGIPLGKR